MDIQANRMLERTWMSTQVKEEQDAHSLTTDIME